MADLAATFGPTLGEHATLGAAVAWMKANYDRSIHDVGDIICVEDAEYNESGIDLSGFNGTPSATNYIRLCAAPGIECRGQFAGARIRGTNSGQHVFSAIEDYVHIKNIAIFQASSGNSRECIRLTPNVSNVLIEKCYLATNNIGSQDCVYSGNYAVTDISLIDCVLESGGGNARACIHAQRFNGSAAQSWHINFCTVDAGTGLSAILAQGVLSSGNVVAMNVYNTIAFDAGADLRDFGEFGPGHGQWTGAGNISSDDGAHLRFGVPNNQIDIPVTSVDAAGPHVILSDVDNTDYQLLQGALANNVAIGTAQPGGFIDPRADQSVDVAGAARPAAITDRSVGAFEPLGAVSSSDYVGSISTILGVSGTGSQVTLQDYTGTVSLSLGVNGSYSQAALQDYTGSVGLLLGLSGTGQQVQDYTGSADLVLGISGTAQQAQDYTGDVGLTLSVSATSGQRLKSNYTGSIGLTLGIDSTVAPGNVPQDYTGTASFNLGITSVSGQTNKQNYTGDIGLTLGIDSIIGQGPQPQDYTGSIGLTLDASALSSQGGVFNYVGSTALSLGVSSISSQGLRYIGTTSMTLGLFATPAQADPFNYVGSTGLVFGIESVYSQADQQDYPADIELRLGVTAEYGQAQANYNAEIGLNLGISSQSSGDKPAIGGPNNPPLSDRASNRRRFGKAYQRKRT